jgi:dUTP pyrophosphatase
MPKIKFQLLRSSAKAPQKMTEHAAGYDLAADLDVSLLLYPGDRIAVPTGIALELPEGFEAQIRPRSGLALKHGIGILNSPGTIDADYRGEVMVILFNSSKEPFPIHSGMRIAQMIIAPIISTELVESDSLNDSVRSSGGFGHTGV